MTPVRVAALQCLVKIVSLYYSHMERYMQAALFAISLEAIKSDVDEIALQGIEFWSSICDEEVELCAYLLFFNCSPVPKHGIFVLESLS